MAKYSYLVRLDLSWSTSRGCDTYGYTIARLDAADTHKRYTCMGGGYDMTGTVFGAWLTDVHQVALCKLAGRAHYLFKTGKPVAVSKKPNSLYGLSAHKKADGTLDRVSLDGGCGIESMIQIARAIGLEVQRTRNKKGHTTGFIVSDKAV